MKKVMLMVFAAAFAVSVAYAATTKETLATESKKWGSFWDREGERSGMKESFSSWGQFWSNMNPGKLLQQQKENYDARKGGQPVSGVTTK